VEFDPRGLVPPPIHPGIGSRRVAHPFMPHAHRELAGEEHRTLPQPVVEDLQHLALWRSRRGRQPEIVAETWRWAGGRRAVSARLDGHHHWRGPSSARRESE
jgi:hypothetical protein